MEIAGFEGDAAKQALFDSLTKSGIPAADADTAAVVDQVSSLPPHAERAVYNHWAAQDDADGQRSRWFATLFAWCFADNGDTEESGGESRELAAMFVRADQAAKSPSSADTASSSDHLQLNSERFHVLKRIIGCSVRIGAQGVQFLESYLRSTSQRFRRSFITSMCGSTHLSNDRLFELQRDLPLRTRKTIFNTVVKKHRAARVAFIDRVLREDGSLRRKVTQNASEGSAVLTLASSEYLREHHVHLPNFSFTNWRLHGDMYEAWVDDQFRQFKSSGGALHAGSFIQLWLRRVDFEELEARSRVARLLLRHEPVAVKSSVDANVSSGLMRMSKTSDPEEFVAACRTHLKVLFDRRCFQRLTPEDTLAILNESWVDGTDDCAAHFAPLRLDVCRWIIEEACADPTHQGRVAARLVDMACAVFDSVDHAVFWGTIVKRKSSTTHTEQSNNYSWNSYSRNRRGRNNTQSNTSSAASANALLSADAAVRASALALAGLLDDFTTKSTAVSLNFAHKLLESWWAMHQRFEPPSVGAVTNFDSAPNTKRLTNLWTSWRNSVYNVLVRLFGIAVSQHQRKVWFAAANPERSSSALLWGKLRAAAAQKLLALAEFLSTKLAVVQSDVAAADPSGAGAAVIRAFAVATTTQVLLDGLVLTPSSHLVKHSEIHSENLVWPPQWNESSAGRSLAEELASTEAAVTRHLAEVAGAVGDVTAPDLWWYGHARRVKDLAQVVQRLVSVKVSASLADALRPVLTDALRGLCRHNGIPLLLPVENVPGAPEGAGAQMLLAGVSAQSVGGAAGQLRLALRHLLDSCTVFVSSENDTAHHRKRVTELFHDVHFFAQQFEVSNALSFRGRTTRCLDWKLWTDGDDHGGSSVVEYLRSLKALPLFLQREEAKSVVMPLLDFVLQSPRRTRRHCSNVVSGSSTVILQEFVVPELLRRLRSAADNGQDGAINGQMEKNIGYKFSDLIALGSLQKPDTQEWVIRGVGNMGDNTMRMAGYVKLLQKALSEEQRSTVLGGLLATISTKIRNESGLVRPVVYAWISENMEHFVELTLNQPQFHRSIGNRLAPCDPSSFDDDDEDPRVQLAAATVIIDALQAMLHDDMSKADSVAKGKFADAARRVLGQVAKADVADTADWREVAKLWIRFSMQVQWDIHKRTNGPESLRLFCPRAVQLQDCVTPQRSTVLHEQLTPWLLSSTGLPKEKIAKHITDVFHKDVHQSTVTSGPVVRSVDKLAMICQELLKIQQAEGVAWNKKQASNGGDETEDAAGLPSWLGTPFLSADALEEGCFFPRDARSLSAQLKWALRCLRSQWVDFQPLTKVLLPKISEGLQREDVPLHHVEQAHALWTQLLQHSTPGAVLTHVRALALDLLRATARLFAAITDWSKKRDSPLACIANGLATSVLSQLRTDEDGGGVTAVAVTELSKDAMSELEHLMSHRDVTFANATLKLKRRRTDLDASTCPKDQRADVKLLLDISRSAIHLHAVQKFLILRRSDLITPFVADPAAKFEGVFAGELPENGVFGDSRDMPSFRWVDSLIQQATGRLRAKELSAIARCDLADMEDSRVGLERKGRHVARFLRSASTGLREHVGLQQKLRARLDANPDDGAASFLLEKVLHAAYNSDQKVWLLAHLLSPQSVATNPHRDTARIIERLFVEFSADAVVSVLRLLLSERRRGAVKVMVHRTIVRTLANIKRGTASGDTLLDEWQLAKLPVTASNRLHPDVVVEMVKSARIGAFDEHASSNDNISALWTILEEAAADTDGVVPVSAKLELLDFSLQRLHVPVHQTLPLVENRRLVAAVEAARAAAYDYSREWTAVKVENPSSSASRELGHLFRLYGGETALYAHEDDAENSTIQRVVLTLRTLCSSISTQLRAVVASGTPQGVLSDSSLGSLDAQKNVEVLRMLLIASVHRLLQATMCCPVKLLSKEQFEGGILASVEAVLFGDLLGPAFELTRSSLLLHTSHSDLLSCGVRLYAAALVQRILSGHDVPLETSTSAAESIKQLVKTLPTTEPLAKRLMQCYTSQIKKLMTLPLTEASARREAFEVRCSLRKALSLPYGVGPNEKLVLQQLQNELFDKPNELEERLLRFEAGGFASI